MSGFRTILVPVDFSDCSAAAVEYALGLASAFEARLVLLHSPLHCRTLPVYQPLGSVQLVLH